MLKSCPSWLPAWKHSAHSDIQGEMPHVLHLYATKLAVHTNPHITALSNFLTKNINDKCKKNLIKKLLPLYENSFCKTKMKGQLYKGD